MSIRVIFAGGGTGGHLFPALAVAQELEKLSPEITLSFLTTGRPLEKEILNKYEYETFEVKSPRKGTLKDNLYFPLRLVLAFLRSLFFLMKSKDEATVIVGLGGYGSVAPLFAAHILRLPTAILEPNLLPGEANRRISRWVDEIYCQWGGSREYFRKKDKVFVTGNPVRQEITSSRGDASYKNFGLSPKRKTLLVLGGSLGAEAINEALAETTERFGPRRQEIQIIHQTGPGKDAGYSMCYWAAGFPAYVTEFIDDMAAAYEAADLVISRAGATTISELTARGLPAILIPYPLATENHQYFNAKILQDIGAAVLLEQKELKAERLAALIKGLLADQGRLRAMAEASISLSRPEARHLVARRILELARG
jgi:UDP-N-acetylglucosamine--N-acetylmuramyl-(pentapeptide) pyrophosphoryl-undecaprenol N-acetylglucosamine transferase